MRQNCQLHTVLFLQNHAAFFQQGENKGSHEIISHKLGLKICLNGRNKAIGFSFEFWSDLQPKTYGK